MGITSSLHMTQLAGEADADLRATATSKMEWFVILVNDWKPLTIITKCSILDVAAALDPPLGTKNLQQLIKLIEQKFISTT